MFVKSYIFAKGGVGSGRYPKGSKNNNPNAPKKPKRNVKESSTSSASDTSPQGSGSLGATDNSKPTRASGNGERISSSVKEGLRSNNPKTKKEALDTMTASVTSKNRRAKEILDTAQKEKRRLTDSERKEVEDAQATTKEANAVLSNLKKQTPKKPTATTKKEPTTKKPKVKKDAFSEKQERTFTERMEQNKDNPSIIKETIAKIGNYLSGKKYAAQRYLDNAKKQGKMTPNRKQEYEAILASIADMESLIKQYS